jgi:hypothetical protein
MPEPKDPRKPAKIAPFVHAELGRLVSDLYTQAKIKTTREDVLGALVIAARDAPIELVAALLPRFIEREAEAEGSGGEADA